MNIDAIAIVDTPHQKSALKKAVDILEPFIKSLDEETATLLTVRIQEGLLRAYKLGRMGLGIYR